MVLEGGSSQAERSPEELYQNMADRLAELSKQGGEEISENDSAKEENEFLEIYPNKVGGQESTKHVQIAGDSPQESSPLMEKAEPVPEPPQGGDPSSPKSLPE